MERGERQDARAGRPRDSRQEAGATLSSKRLLWRFMVVILTLGALFLSGAPSEKHLSVYSLAANYSLPLVQREGREYVGLLELLEPLGKVSAKSDGSRWRLRYNNAEGIFQASKTRARVQDRDTDLGGKFLMENKRGLVPVGSLSSLLPRFLGGPVSLHEDSNRLFIGSAATHFTAALAGDNPPKLVFHFTSPVNPSIATEPGSLRMTFSREPLVGPASPTLTFGSKAIPSASYSEGNGSAVVTVNSTIPVMATFGNDGRTITVAPTAAGAAAQSAAPTGTPAAGSSPTPGQAASPVPVLTPAPQVPAARRYFAVVDASHGGDDHGETLSSSLLEKDVTVALARSLRQELESRGITTLVLRDSDANLSLDQRAIFANADHAAIYIALHAASSGRGVRVFTALLPFGGDDRGPFRSWTTAQHATLPLSQATASAVVGELQKRQVPVRDLVAPLRPLNNVAGPAIAVEIAPQGSDVSQLTAPDYQQLVTSAVATAIAANRDQLGAAP
ncbi:MAG TPA: N-acetylmuramoyl-L-alanine amidase [Candidatus Sulfotelmatobacter sp.]|nr:N-acetylmuramoyl-L-alanine amidase [Candidatus Sulfotelmatobacter sp.]